LLADPTIAQVTRERESAARCCPGTGPGGSKR